MWPDARDGSFDLRHTAVTVERGETWRWFPTRLDYAVATPPLFRPWRSALAAAGFSPSTTGGRRGLSMTRERDGITTALGTMLHARREDAFCVVLHVSQPFPFADPPHDVILVSGDLTQRGVRIDDPGPPRPGSTTWWPVADVARAWEAVEAHGLPFLERMSGSAALIEFFESELEPRGLIGSLRAFFRPDHVRPPRRRYLLWLALLSERNGEPAAARDFLGRYVVASGRDAPDNDERRRIERRLAELRGTGSVVRGLARDDFLDRFGETWRSVFSGRPILDGAFRDAAWEQILLPDPRAQPSPAIDAWLGAVREVAEDETSVFTEDESDDRHAVTVLTPASRDGLRDAFTRTELADIYAYWTGFGPSGRWGMVFEENFACLAGDPAFMRACIEASGGRHALEQGFLRWADGEWEASDRHLEAVLARVGWR